MQKSLEEQIGRARELLDTAKHAAMATVNSDGSPHNSPFFFMHDAALTHVLWGSHPESVHSKNVLRTGKLFVVLYDAFERGGLFMEAAAGHMLAGAELEAGLRVNNELRHKYGQGALPLSYYEGTSPQRMWLAEIRHLWVNGTQRDASGLIVRDVRTEIEARDLVG